MLGGHRKALQQPVRPLEPAVGDGELAPELYRVGGEPRGHACRSYMVSPLPIEVEGAFACPERGLLIVGPPRCLGQPLECLRFLGLLGRVSLADHVSPTDPASPACLSLLHSFVISTAGRNLSGNAFPSPSPAPRLGDGWLIPVARITGVHGRKALSSGKRTATTLSDRFEQSPLPRVHPPTAVRT